MSRQDPFYGLPQAAHRDYRPVPSLRPLFFILDQNRLRKKGVAGVRRADNGNLAHGRIRKKV